MAVWRETAQSLRGKASTPRRYLRGGLKNATAAMRTLTVPLELASALGVPLRHVKDELADWNAHHGADEQRPDSPPGVIRCAVHQRATQARQHVRRGRDDRERLQDAR